MRLKIGVVEAEQARLGAWLYECHETKIFVFKFFALYVQNVSIIFYTDTHNMIEW